MHKIIILFLFVSLIFKTTNIYGQEVNIKLIDSLLTRIESKDKGMLSLSISKDGKAVYSRAIGYSVKEAAKLSNTQTKYRIGSITKTFTAVLILQLIEENRLSLATNLARYFPSIPNASSITIEQLLRHRSGIHNITDDESYLGYMTKGKTQDELIDIIKAQKPDFAPGSSFTYSNSGYILLGFILEKIRGESYDKILQKFIVNKLTNKDIYYGGKINPANNEAKSYDKNDGWMESTETDMSIPHGAGAIVATPDALVGFLEELFKNKLVTSESVELMKEMKDNYGLGLFRMPFYDKFAFGHNGSIDGFGSSMAYFVEDKLAIALCTNAQDYEMNEILIVVLSACFDRPVDIPDFKEIKLEPEVLNLYIGDYTSKEMPIAIKVFEEKGVLKAQATGQGSFNLTPETEHVFSFKTAGIVISFDPLNKAMKLQQGGRSFNFLRK